MTLQQAIMDPDRPLSVSPYQWIQYEEAKDNEEQEIVDQAIELIQEQQKTQQDYKVQEKLDIGIEQMVIGCRIAIRTLQQIQRKDLGIKQRQVYKNIKDLIFNAVSPYLADVLKERKKLYK